MPAGELRLPGAEPRAAAPSASERSRDCTPAPALAWIEEVQGSGSDQVPLVERTDPPPRVTLRRGRWSLAHATETICGSCGQGTDRWWTSVTPLERGSTVRWTSSAARRAEESGFTFALVSDHFHPWIDRQGQSPFVWGVIGGIASATDRWRLGTGVRARRFDSRRSSPGLGGDHPDDGLPRPLLPRRRDRNRREPHEHAP